MGLIAAYKKPCTPFTRKHAATMIPPFSDKELSQTLACLCREEGSVLLETTRISQEEHRSYLFTRPCETITAFAGDDPVILFKKIEENLKKGYYLAGWLAYELGYLLEPSLARNTRLAADQCLAWFGVYPAPHVYDHLAKRFQGAGPLPNVEQKESAGYSVGNLRPNLTEDQYQEAIARIKSYIEAGDTYQVNYTLKLLFDFQGDAVALYKALRRNQSVSYSAFMRCPELQVISFSPELFFKTEGNTCRVRPMKGTITRGPHAEKDHELAEFLQNDIKNRSENVMIVDLLRNDLGRICEQGSVTTTSLFDLETYETLHQMTSTIEGTLAAGTGIPDLFKALFPCGSVTGAPKIRTMEIIRELEQAPRGIYTGAIGFLAPDGQACFNVPIRTITIRDSQGEMGIGSGVVYDSDPHQEWEECLLKGRFLTSPAPLFTLIETILWQPQGGYWLLDAHLDRLGGSADFFQFAFDRQAILDRLHDMAKAFGSSCRRVRLTLAKDGQAEISAHICEPPAAILPGPDLKTDLPQVRFSKIKTDENSPYYYHKTTIRDLYNSERAGAVEEGCYEVLFTNSRGEVTEGSITNIFIRKDNVILTPPVECGLLDGVFRRYFLANSPLPVRESRLTIEDIRQADALYVGNSVRGLIQVRLED